MDIILDGYNVLQGTPFKDGGESPDIEGGRIFLLDVIAKAARDYEQNNYKVVFTSGDRGGVSELKEKYKSVLVIYSKKTQTSFHIIKRLLRDQKRTKLVISDDPEIISLAQEKNADIQSPLSFYQELADS